MSWYGWLGILLAGVASAAVALWVHLAHPNWGVDDYSKTVGMWLVLFAALAAAWISYLNGTAQVRSSQRISANQEKLQRDLHQATAVVQRDLARLNASLALNLEEAKIQIANRYQAQVALNQVAMTAADQIHTLQRDVSSMSEAQEILDRIREASQAMRRQRGALLMVTQDYRRAWEELQQQVVYIEERVAEQLRNGTTVDLRLLYREHNVGVVFGELWGKFNEIASFKENRSE
jgi:hypothetical protein